MKPVILAVLVLLLVSQNEALKCYCGGKRQCSNPIETCSGTDNVCASVIFHAPIYSYFKGCYRRTDCLLLNQPGLISATCCGSDLCN
uniref:Snake toxin/toxin-like domain-containing protein n=1 Tax=Kryptolebias marmoratus TaxID=37003 RepID=A0A3Q3BF95_KRYMA